MLFRPLLSAIASAVTSSPKKNGNDLTMCEYSNMWLVWPCSSKLDLPFLDYVFITTTGYVLSNTLQCKPSCFLVSNYKCSTLIIYQASQAVYTSTTHPLRAHWPYLNKGNDSNLSSSKAMRTEVYKPPVNIFYHLALITISMTIAMMKTNDVCLDQHNSLRARRTPYFDISTFWIES